MSRWLMFAIFFTVFLLIIVGMHFYLYRRLVVGPALPQPWNLVAGLVLILLALSIPLSFFLTRILSGTAAKLVLYPVYVWLGMLFLTFCLLLGLDAVKLVAWAVSRAAGHEAVIADAGRRLFLSRLLAGGVAAAVFIATGTAMRKGLGPLAIRRINVTLPNLPVSFDGFTIAQITDLHLTALQGRDWFAGVVASTNSLKPDLIAVTGDLADGTVAQLGKDAEPVNDLRAPHGVFFVTGNHEYFFDLDNWLTFIDQAGLRILRNERVQIARGQDSFDLAGVDDQEGGHIAPGHGTDVGRALADRDSGRALVLLAHQPRTVKQAAEHGAGLVLSGHTHGGQVWPFRYMVYIQQPYVSGLHDHNGTKIYVSNGTGYWGPPMRLGTTPEITLITLRSPRVD